VEQTLMRGMLLQSVTFLGCPFLLREKRCGKDKEAIAQGSLYDTKTDCSRVSERLHRQRERCGVSVVKIRMTFARAFASTR